MHTHLSKHVLLSGIVALIFLLPVVSPAQKTYVAGRKGSEKLGSHITVLTNGNYVVTDPEWNDGGKTHVGAVYLYNGANHQLISTLTGSKKNDRVGSRGVTALSNGNFVVCSPEWSNGPAAFAGAVTWANGTTGISGKVDASNSLVGSMANNFVGVDNITPLPNGNYVVRSTLWDNGAVTDAGAATWGNGATGITGVVNASNSLIGTKKEDKVGFDDIKVLTNGNYVVQSRAWDNGSVQDAGAATWGNGTTGVTGEINVSNSLIGSHSNDQIGYAVVVLTNGNYVVQSEYWDNGSIVDAGAATWGNGLNGVTGFVSASNSLVGTAEADNVGIVTALANGNYVVATPRWANGPAQYAGAVTWADGTKGITGTISISNSLVGSRLHDGVGMSKVCALTNGNYVVGSQGWQSAPGVFVGAATWANGATGLTGPVSASNSLIGSTNEDGVGSMITALTNGNYVVTSEIWNNGPNTSVGAATFANGSTGLVGVVSKSNSLIGYHMYDNVGRVIALKNGNYVVYSPWWNNGSERDAGAVTLGNGTTGSIGVVSPFNSLVGSTYDDLVGWDVTALSDGNYVVASRTWRNRTNTQIGAVTWCDGTKNMKGPVSDSNSLVGSVEFRYVGYVVPFDNGDYYISNNDWFDYNINDYVGAMTPMPRKTPLSGVVKSCNSILGTKPFSGNRINVTWNSVYQYALVGTGGSNFYAIVNDDPVADSNLAGDYSEDTKRVWHSPETFLNDCGEIGIVTPYEDGNTVTGPVKMKVYVALSAPATDQPYVRRYFSITPEANAGTATGQVTLFIGQSDFDDFNENRGDAPALPSGPTDSDGIQNIRITQIHGTSQTGYPNSYTGWTGSGPAAVLINPKDQDIVWNDSAKRWEISFAVKGFSGFFVHSNVNEQALPVHLVSFTAVKSEGNALLKWQTISEINASHFDIERSVDGKNFIKVGIVKTTGNGDYAHSYSFVDTTFASLGQLVYYRLRAVDTDGSYAYSAIQHLQAEVKPASTYVYPNPVRAGSSVTISADGAPRNIQIVDLAGRSVSGAIIQRSNTGFVLSKLPQGVHLVKFDTDRGPEVRKLVVE